MMTGRGKPNYLEKTFPSAFYAAVIPYEMLPDWVRAPDFEASVFAF